MEKKLYKELWNIRFQKMLRLEKKSVTEYGVLLEECLSRYGDHALRPHFARLVEDEKKHVLLVEELLKILSRQPG